MSETAVHSNANAGFRPWQMITTYKPFIVSLLATLAASYVIELSRTVNGSVPSDELMRTFMGGFFIVFAAPKFLNLRGFVTAFRQYDLVSQRLTSYAWAYPFIELTLGIALIANDSMALGRLITIAVALLSGMGIISVSRALRQDKELTCACLGARFSFPLSGVTLVENGLMFVMALGMLLHIVNMQTLLRISA